MNKITKDFLRPFSDKGITELHTLALRMQEYDLTSAEVIALIDDHIADMMTRQQTTIKPTEIVKSKHCPQCGSVLRTISVNSTRCTLIGGNYTKMDICQNYSCVYTRPY